MTVIFDFGSYRDFLLAQIEKNRDVRSYRGKLAEAAGCQRSFLSQVMTGGMELSLEHGMGLAEFFQLSTPETDFFLTLIQYERAAIPRLKKHFKDKIEYLRGRQVRLSERFSTPALERPELELMYFSSWQIGAVHAALEGGRFSNPEAIAKRFGIAPPQVNAILQSLLGAGLAKLDAGKWKSTRTSIHLPKTSPMEIVNQANWRMRAIARAQDQEGEGLHYTSVFSLAKKDYLALKTLIVRQLEESRSVISKSGAEEVYSLCCDLFFV